MRQELLRPIRGIIPPLVTPLTEQGKLDEEGLGRLIGHVSQGGVHGLFILGTTGEGPSLSRDTQEAVIRSTAKVIDGNLPLFVGVSHPSMEESVDLARVAADAGCDAIVATPPYYFELQQDELKSYYMRLAQECCLPVLLYNMPTVTGTKVAPQTVKHLMSNDAIVGVKDSSGDLQYFQSLVSALADRPDFPVIMGPENLLADSLALGGAGGVAGGANIWPALFVKLYEEVSEGGPNQDNRLRDLVSQLGQIYQVGEFSIPSIVARTKTALSLLGICGNSMAPPFSGTTKDEGQKIALIIEELGILGVSPNSEYVRSL